MALASKAEQKAAARLARSELLGRALENTENARAPWLGYQPDISDERSTLSVASDAANLVEREGALTADIGFAILTPSKVTLDFPLGDDGAGAIAGPATGFGDVPETIVCIGQVPIQSPTLQTTNIAPFFVTAKNGGVTIGHAATISDTNDLVEIPYSAAVIAGGDEIAADADSLFDWAIAPWGGTAVAGLRTGAAVITNNVDNCYIWDMGSGGAFPGAIDYIPGGEPAGAIVNFKARSCALFHDRIVFLNTEEAGVRWYRRLRWTPVGSLNVNPATVGAGFRDLQELKDRGSRLLPIGNLLAAYGEGGVVFLRKVEVPTAPFVLDYRSDERGLLAPRAVVSLGEDLHFGIFTDGWFLLDSQGRWREVGLGDAGGVPYSKWRSEFYARLSEETKDLTVVHHDRLRDHVRVSFASGGSATNNETWVYDVKTDSVWPQNFGPSYYADISLPSDSIDWTEVVGSWSANGVSWASLVPSVDFRTMVHGDQVGNVMVYDPDLYQRNGANVSYGWQSHWQRATHMSEERTLERFYLTRSLLSASNRPIAMGVLDAENSLSAATVPTTAGTGREAVYTDPIPVSSSHHAFSISGTHPQVIHSMEMEFSEDTKEVGAAEGVTG
jgi:hypothetical protein